MGSSGRPALDLPDFRSLTEGATSRRRLSRRPRLLADKGSHASAAGAYTRPKATQVSTRPSRASRLSPISRPAASSAVRPRLPIRPEFRLARTRVRRPRRRCGREGACRSPDSCRPASTRRCRSRDRAGARSSARISARLDETRNYGETDREFLLRAEAEVVFGRDRRRCCPTARFVRFYKLQAEAADPSTRTHRPAPPDRERNSGAPIAVAQPRAYVRPGSLTAATLVELAAAIAQKQKPRAACPTAPRSLQWNATSHADRHGHGYRPGDAAPGGADLTAALHR